MEKSNSKKARGRPPIGRQITVAIGPDLLAAIQCYRANNFDSRPLAETLRELLEYGYETAARGKGG